MTERSVLNRLDLPLSVGKAGTEHAGSRQSQVRGSGLDVVSTRPYIPGDDPRSIDWPATARTGEIHSRVTLALRARRVHIVVGGGGRMTFGPQRTKWATGIEVARILTEVAYLGQDLLTLHTTHDGLSYHAPGRRLGDQLAFLKSLETAMPSEHDTGEISATVNHLVHQSRHRGAIIAIGDSFPSETDIDGVLSASVRHAAAYIEVYDPYEWALPEAGRVRLRGSSQAGLPADLTQTRLRERYAGKVYEKRQQWISRLRGSGVPTLEISTRDPVADTLARQLPRRR